MVEYDSIIPPGQEGKVTQQVKMSKLKSGTFTKSVKVMSNASNIEVLRLSLSGKILSVINLSHRFIHLRQDSTRKLTGSLELSTEKPDLIIKEISFKEQKSSKPSWQKEPILYLKYSMTRADSADVDGYYAYSLKFSIDIAPPERLSGMFTFNTNHREREKITIRGMIAPVEEKKK